MKITKKLLAVLLSALILMASLPVMAVSAAEELTTDDGFKYTVTETEATVTGYTGTATELVIPEEMGGVPVTHIDSDAFKDNTAIVSVTLPSTLENIGGGAFRGCTALTAVEIPDSVTSIGGWAFGDCTSLKDVKLSKELTSLGYSAFKATAIEEIQIPKALNSANRDHFDETYTFGDKEYYLERGPFVLCDNLKTVTFEKGTTKVANYLFAGCTGIESVTIPDTVTKIEEAAFMDCLRLSEVNIPDTVTEIGAGAFESCVSLKGVELPKGLTTLNNCAFAFTALESIEIPRNLDNANRQTFAESYDFNGVEYSVERGPFLCCDNLKTVTFEKGSTQVAKYLFAGCTGIESVTIPDTVTIIEEAAFMDCLRLSEVNMPDMVTVIENGAFESCVSLKEIELSSSLKTMEDCAFAYTALESIEIPKSLDASSNQLFGTDYTLDGTTYSVERGPFVLCENLKTVTFEEGSTQIAKSVLSGAVAVEEIVIPEGVEVIEEDAFRTCLRLKSITFPSTLKKIDLSAFNTCVSLEEMVVPETVTEIGDSAFRNCDALKSIEFKNADATLGEAAIADNKALADVVLPANLKEIDDGLFYNNTSLETVGIPASVTVIRSEVFEGCASLDEVVIPEGVTEIGYEAFMNCTSLKSINIPYAVDVLGRNAFEGCESLAKVEFADYSIKEIKEKTFKDCYSLTEIQLPKGLLTIGEEAFMNGVELYDVIIPDSVEEIADNAFSYPGKTTIYSQTGSYVEEYANDGGFKFEDNVKEVETIKLKDGATKLILEENKTYFMDFELDPVDANECIKLTTSDDYVVGVDGMELKTNWRNETVEITAETFSGATFTFEVYVRGIDYIRVADGTYQEKYAMGDEFNPEGMVVNAHYSDGTVVEIDNYTVEGFDSSEAGTVTLTVKWADKDGDEYDDEFEVEILGEGEELPTLNVQQDVNTQVIVEAYTDAKLAVVEVTEKIKIDEVNLVLVGEKVAKLYDITLNKNGEAVQPDGDVTVKIPAENENSKVYRVEEDGTLTDMGAVYEDGFMVFTTEHFSLYVVTVDETESAFETGDVNKDGKLNIRDATAIQKYIAKMIDLDDEAIALADFDGNGKVNVKDATSIQKRIAGII